MKRISIAILSFLTVVAVLLSGCQKDFLVQDPSGDIVGDKKIKKYIDENPSVGATLQNAIFNGLYSWMYTAGAGGTRMHVDFGQKGFDIELDMISGDFIKPTNDYGWDGGLQRYVDLQDKTRLNHYAVWRYYYRLIFTANGLIDQLGGDEAKPEAAESKHNLGQALGVRGYAYFYLTQMFANEYKPSEPLVPIYRTLEDKDKPVATQQEVYDRAISDLSRAIELLADFNPSEKYMMSADVART